MSKHTDTTLAKVAKLDTDIEALRARLAAKLDEREAILAELVADGEAIRQALGIGISAEPATPAPQERLAPVGKLLTDEQVREIRRLYGHQGMSQSALARRFGLSQPSIHRIIKGLTYKEVA
jgi:DNA-binding transcriptional regulator YiaG